ncbi:Voltage-Dependent N-Type Calcium Channel Subunit Alpha-1B [Manis pentadactyla]|nr:Voltage-Dependent N-Type Calcium Channel Subunit Alpha-1B [Manis pentadactyla]
MQGMALRGPAGEPQPGLESQGRAASMPRLAAETQPPPDASPMKRSISTLAPQRPRVAHLCNATLDSAPASQAASHHHHRCHRRRDRKQKSLEKGPSLSADTDGAPSSTAGPGPPQGEGPVGCQRERRQEHGRFQERRQSSSSEKQRFYSCDRFGGREPPQPKPSLSSHPTSPMVSQEPGPLRQGSGSVNGSPLLSTSGASTPGRGGRRQLPQTPLTPRPSITYKTANSSPVHFAGAQTSLPAFSRGQLSHGLSEHNALLLRDTLSQPLAPGSRIGSDLYLGQRLDSEVTAHTQPEDTLTFEDAVATNSGCSSQPDIILCVLPDLPVPSPLPCAQWLPLYSGAQLWWPALGLLKEPLQMQALAPELRVTLPLVLDAALKQLLERTLWLEVDCLQALELSWLRHQHPAPGKVQERVPVPALIPETELELQEDERSPQAHLFMHHSRHRIIVEPSRESQSRNPLRAPPQLHPPVGGLRPIFAPGPTAASGAPPHVPITPTHSQVLSCTHQALSPSGLASMGSRPPEFVGGRWS